MTKKQKAKLKQQALAWIGLGLGLILTCVLARVGQAPKDQAQLIQGNSLESTVGMVKLRGKIQYVKASGAGALTLNILADDGTPVQVYAGPECDREPGINSGKYVVFEGKQNGGLFLVSRIRLESRGNVQVYPVRTQSDRWAYVQRGAQIIRVPITGRSQVKITNFGNKQSAE